MDDVVDRGARDGRALEARHAAARTEIETEAERTLTEESGATGMSAGESTIGSTIGRTANESGSESANGTRRGGAAPAPSAGGRRRLQRSTTLSSREPRGTPAWATE